MVWFQCEDCGENLKKPKLPNHFRMCSASQLSCIDCSQIFSRQSVQGHTQCITEAEKYGPKGLTKTANGTPKQSNEKKKPDVDINVGLSTRFPWFCSLCNTQATSQQTLLLHADGKKHRAKARAYHVANQPNKTSESSVANGGSTADIPKNESSESNNVKVENNMSGVASDHNNSTVQNGDLSMKKRKIDVLEGDDTKRTVTGSVEVEGKVKKVKHIEQGEDDKVDKLNHSEKGSAATKLNWKKLISSILESAPDHVLKMKKLRKRISKSLKESCISMEDNEVESILEQKVNSSSRFTVDGKYVRLASKN